MKNGYRLHIETETGEAVSCDTMRDVRRDQKMLSMAYNMTLEEVEKISYIVTEEEYQRKLLEKQMIREGK